MISWDHQGINMEKIKIEIRAAEGGADAKLLVKDLAGIYSKFCQRRRL